MFPKNVNKEKKNKQKKIDVEKLKKQNYERVKRNIAKQNEKIKNKIEESSNVEYKTIDVEKLKKQNYERVKRNIAKQNEKIKNKIEESSNVEYKTIDVEKLKKQNYERVKKYVEKNNTKAKTKKIRTSKRSKFSEYSITERKAIYERDMEKCIYCSGKVYLGIAHIFASRTKGGKGCKENGVVLCQICHNNLDNGKDENLRNEIQKYCENYLTNNYPKLNINELIYKK